MGVLLTKVGAPFNFKDICIVMSLPGIPTRIKVFHVPKGVSKAFPNTANHCLPLCVSMLVTRNCRYAVKIAHREFVSYVLVPEPASVTP